MRSYRKAWMSYDRRVITHEVPEGKTPSNPGTEALDDSQVTEVALFTPFRQDLPFQIWNYLSNGGGGSRTAIWASFDGVSNISWTGFDGDGNPVASLGQLGNGLGVIPSGLELANRVFTWDYYSNHPLD